MAVKVGYEPLSVGSGNGDAEKSPSAGNADVYHPQRFSHLRVGDRAGQPGRQGAISHRAGGHEQQDGLGLVTLGLVDGTQSGPSAGCPCRRQPGDGARGAVRLPGAG